MHKNNSVETISKTECKLPKKNNMELTVQKILKATNGHVLTGTRNESITGVSIDSRKADAGNLFIPLKGEKCDGHAFIADAFNHGASASFVQRGNPLCKELLTRNHDKTLIEVDDPLKSLGDLAHFWRSLFSTKIAAITGSNGKTTTKEITWNIIADKIPSIKNQGNWNNLIGLPLSLFQLNENMEVAILEMGMSQKGEIRRLAEICRPQIGLITNIGPCHLEQLHTLEDVKDAKAELLEYLGHGDTAIINNDDLRTASLSERTSADIVSFGVNKGDIHAVDIRSYNCFGSEFDLIVMGNRITVKLKLMGKQFVNNALAAAAIAHVLGISIEDIKRGLESFHGVPGRMEIITLSGVRIINDAYNANPVSMNASLSALSSVASGNKKMAVLGDMLELGSESIKFHRELGEKVAKSNIDLLFLTGDFSSFVREGAVAAGMNPSNIVLYKDLKKLSEDLRFNMREGDSILLKGSRKMGLEKLIELLKHNGN
jgi:UDP-N-acetylmuramoyl-tripeptide--D-alanyl-D-alanine ligase